MLLSYRYRIEPNKEQAALLSEMFADFCQLYNAALEHRIGAHRKGVNVGFFDQSASLTSIRADLPHIGRWSRDAEAQVLRRLDKTFQAFFRRIKRGEKPGFPRFRSMHRYHSADYRLGHGLTIRDSGKLRVVGIPGEIRVRCHRELPSDPKSCVLTRKAGKWYVAFHVEIEAPEYRSGRPAGSVGLDVGLSSLVALSSGETIARPLWIKRYKREHRRRQRALARCQLGSKIRAKRKASLAKLHFRIANKRRDYLHKLSHNLVNRFDRIAIEDLNVRGLMRTILSKHVADASWTCLTTMLAYKAARAGSEMVKVDPRGTSQTCPGCGTIAAKQLKERVHRCECGCVLDRDVAAAMVVHYRAFGFWPGTGLGSLSQRDAA